MTQDRAKPATTLKREQRLAQALRENLKRRKQQARRQAESGEKSPAKPDKTDRQD